VKVAEVPVAGRKLWKVLVPAALILVAAAIVGAFYFRSLQATSAAVWLARKLDSAMATPIRSIAVLPLANLSGDPQQEYFADGMTEALTAELGQIGSLRVISRTSVMQYKGTKKPLPQIARELNVDAVIEGSVFRVGDRVRITAQLIGVAPERHLWARNYERDLRDVLSLQGEIARTIADEVKANVTPSAQARLASALTTGSKSHRRRWIFLMRPANSGSQAARSESRCDSKALYTRMLPLLPRTGHSDATNSCRGSLLSGAKNSWCSGSAPGSAST
jgi:TolB-like protein